MKTKERTIKVSEKCYKELLRVKKLTGVPIKRIVEDRMFTDRPLKSEFVN